MQIKDKIVVVTGAASGIGREIARAFLADGARVTRAKSQATATTSSRRRELPSMTTSFDMRGNVFRPRTDFNPRHLPNTTERCFSRSRT